MSEKLPRVTANEMIKIVKKLGFRFSRQSGILWVSCLGRLGFFDGGV
jgi:hypothetical protein